MGFWKSVAKVAVGIAAPGALAGWEYQEYKQEKELLQELDDAIGTLFKTASVFSDEDCWSELLVTIKGLVIKTISDKKSRESLLKEAHREEIGRLCCELAFEFARNETIVSFAKENGADPDLAVGCFMIPLLYCKELDAKLEACQTLTKMEVSVVRLVFDLAATRVIPIVLKQNSISKDTSEGLNNILRDIFAEESVQNLCKENKVEASVILRKLAL